MCSIIITDNRETPTNDGILYIKWKKQWWSKWTIEQKTLKSYRQIVYGAIKDDDTSQVCKPMFSSPFLEEMCKPGILNFTLEKPTYCFFERPTEIAIKLLYYFPKV